MIECYNNYIINPTVELTPSIRISPFKEDNFSCLNVDESIALQYLSDRFGDYMLTMKARDAICLALSYYNLQPNDVVTILTTSNNFYISSCVTNSIEKYCLWSREITDRTKVIFVNHEFGYPYMKLESLLNYGLPIIEDCAHSFVSMDTGFKTGTVGDFVIYSLPKFFPMQIGGVLVADKLKLDSLKNEISLEAESYILRHLSLDINNIASFVSIRLDNYRYLQKKLENLGIRPFFPLESETVPGVFLFTWMDNVDYSSLKIFMQKNGVESSVFYGKKAFFVPIHHRLGRQHLDYIATLLKYYINVVC
jgi:degT/dnrJ/eryC1/strS aminotransferase